MARNDATVDLAAVVESPKRAGFDDLNDYVLLDLLKNLSTIDKVKYMRVNKRFREAIERTWLEVERLSEQDLSSFIEDAVPRPGGNIEQAKKDEESIIKVITKCTNLKQICTHWFKGLSMSTDELALLLIEKCPNLIAFCAGTDIANIADCRVQVKSAYINYYAANKIEYMNVDVSKTAAVDLLKNLVNKTKNLGTLEMRFAMKPHPKVFLLKFKQLMEKCGGNLVSSDLTGVQDSSFNLFLDYCPKINNLLVNLEESLPESSYKRMGEALPLLDSVEMSGKLAYLKYFKKQQFKSFIWSDHGQKEDALEVFEAIRNIFLSSRSKLERFHVDLSNSELFGKDNLQNMAKLCPNINDLRLGFHASKISGQSVAAAVSCLRNLKLVSIIGIEFTKSDIEGILEHCQKLACFVILVKESLHADFSNILKAYAARHSKRKIFAMAGALPAVCSNKVVREKNQFKNLELVIERISDKKSACKHGVQYDDSDSDWTSEDEDEEEENEA